MQCDKLFFESLQDLARNKRLGRSNALILAFIHNRPYGIVECNAREQVPYFTSRYIKKAYPSLTDKEANVALTTWTRVPTLKPKEILTSIKGYIALSTQMSKLEKTKLELSRLTASVRVLRRTIEIHESRLVSLKKDLAITTRKVEEKGLSNKAIHEAVKDYASVFDEKSLRLLYDNIEELYL